MNLAQILQASTVWVLKFASETADAWKKDNNDVYMLKEDFNKMPIHKDLDETVGIDPEIIDTSTINKKILTLNIVKTYKY